MRLLYKKYLTKRKKLNNYNINLFRCKNNLTPTSLMRKTSIFHQEFQNKLDNLIKHNLIFLLLTTKL